MATNNLYTTKTAALKATKADVNKLETKKLKVNGKDVATSVKHPNDTREVITENDLWGSWAEITKDGEIIFHDDEVTNPNGNSTWNRSITKVEDNKAYVGDTLVGDTLYGNIQTENIANGYLMFDYCENLVLFDSDLSSLTSGYGMFRGCAFTSFNSDLSSLTTGNDMFGSCTNLTTFESNMSSLKNATQMFSGCTSLTLFTSDLSKLEVGMTMFQSCENLTTFVSDLSSLTNGYNMFFNCKLDTDSLMHIAETIRDVRNLTNSGTNPWNGTVFKTIHIGIGNIIPTEEEIELLTEIHNKGWKVYVNGYKDENIFTPTVLTPIDGEEVTTPIPYWAKPQEVDEEHAEYVGEDGKFYIILGGNYIFVDDPETYGLFTSLEDAAANMRLTKIEKTEIEKA